MPSFVRGLPTIVTMAALISGMLSIYSAILAVSVGDSSIHLLHSALLIMLAMILDGLDGNLARLLHATSELGGELDTFVDLTAFGIAPALLIYASAQSAPLWLRVALGCALTASGAYRLSRFKVVDPYRGQKGFLGLPITVCAGMVASFHIMAIRAPDSWDMLNVDLAGDKSAAFLLVLAAVLAVLQVSRLRFPKPTKHPLFFIPSFVLVLLLFSGNGALSSISAILMLLFGIYYIVLAPLLALRNSSHG